MLEVTDQAPQAERTVAREDLPDGWIRFSTPEGEVQARHMAPGVLFTRYYGQMGHPLTAPVEVEMMRALAARTPGLFFCDGTAAKGYEVRFRLFWTSWCRKHRASLGAFHLLVTSRLLAMGAAVVNMAVGGELVRVYSDRRAFEAALGQALRQRV